MTQGEFVCAFCGGDPWEADHQRRCDGRQGGREDGDPSPDQDLVRAKGARDHAIAEVESFADESFMAAAYAAIHQLALARSMFVIDDVWAARARWPATHDRRAMGAAILQARRDGLIEPTSEFRLTAQVLRHAAPVRVWRSLVVGSTA